MAQAEIKAVITAEDKASKTIAGVGNSFSSMAAAMAVGTLAAKAVSAALDVLQQHLGSAIQRVDTLNNFPKIMQNLGYSTEDAAFQMKRLEQGVLGLPTSLSDIATAMQNIAPSSKSLDEATDLALALNNALLAGGQSAELQSSAMMQFSQAISKGKPDMMEWRALATAMPGQLDQITQSLGYGRGEWQKMASDVSDGVLPFSKVKDAIVKLNKEGLGKLPSFAEQAKQATGGINTAIANMHTAITRGIANIIQTIGASNISMAITSFGNAFENALKWIKENGIKTVDLLKKAWDFLLPSITALTNTVKNELWPSLQRLYEEVLKPLLPFLGGALVGVLYLMVNQWNLLANAIAFVTTAFTNFWNWAKPYVMPVLIEFGNVIKTVIWPAIQELWRIIQTQLLPTLVEFWDKNKNWLIPALQVLAGIVGGVLVVGFSMVAAAILVVLGVITALVKGVEWLVKWWQLLINILNGVAHAFANTVGGAVYNMVRGIQELGRGVEWVIGLFNKLANISIGNARDVLRSLKVPGFASGVTNFSGGMAVVGERGPELVNLPKGSSVIPNNKISSVGGNTTININVGLMTGSAIERREAAAKMFEDLKVIASQQGQTVGQMLGA